ncbi:hypothetical protein [Actinomadura rupiterrae]|uniref:hypothetical protein n=1 Tax=Actinomadura rupiterrae TaxID=559627 RepID=UPI0020A4DF90|nr:hypothetical protein [Actinomadura rupiterrae]MCP2338496.1 hypothetical protein [Actinomadura rupiterrae]
MLSMHLAALTDGLPDGVDDASALVDGFDDALTHGLGRLGEPQAAALEALAAALSAAPLGPAIAEAAAKAGSGSPSEDGLGLLAAGRAALLGAVHDALLGRFDTAAGRVRAAWDEPAPEPPGGTNLLAGARSWLHEVAVTGWRGVGHDLVSAVDPTVEALLADPGSRRIAALMDGLAAELRASSPVATMARVPARRWGDLWSRPMLLTWQDGASGGRAEPVSGRLLPLGVDVHEHPTAVQIQVHGVLESGEGKRLVRASVSAGKVDTIVGPAIWRLLDDFPVLLAALAGQRAVEIDGMPLLPGGDLLWSEDAADLGESADPFATARLQLDEATAPPVPPLERHPVRIAEPVLLEGYRVDGGDLVLDDHRLRIETGNLPGSGPLTPELVRASSTCVGLVRWDAAGWSLRPLAVQAVVKKKPVTAHGGEWALGPTDPKIVKAQAKSGDAVAVLRERAGRLLRK